MSVQNVRRSVGDAEVEVVVACAAGMIHNRVSPQTKRDSAIDAGGRTKDSHLPLTR